MHTHPPRVTYQYHIPAYRADATMNKKILFWEPEPIVSLSQGIKVVPSSIPGSQDVMDANVVGLRDFQITLWSKHGVMARSDLSVTRAVDRIEYAETGAKPEYMDLAAGSRAAGACALGGGRDRHGRVEVRVVQCDSPRGRVPVDGWRSTMSRSMRQIGVPSVGTSAAGGIMCGRRIDLGGRVP